MRRLRQRAFALVIGLTLAVSGMPFEGLSAVQPALAAPPAQKICFSPPDPFTGISHIVRCPPDPSIFPSNDDPIVPEQRDPCAVERANHAAAVAEVQRAEAAVATAQEGVASARAAWNTAIQNRVAAQTQKTIAEGALATANRALIAARAAYHQAVISAKHTPPWPYEQALIDAAAERETLAIEAVNAAQTALTTATTNLTYAQTAEQLALEAWSKASGVLGIARADEAKALLAFAAAQRALRSCEARNRPASSAA